MMPVIMAGSSKIRASAAEMLEMCREAIEQEHGPQGDRPWDPIVEMAVVAADPALPRPLAAGLNKELAQYFYPKLKAVEHTGDSAPTIVLAQFTANHELIPIGEVEEAIPESVKQLPSNKP